MISVTVDNSKDNDSVVVYELAEGSSVIDLKFEIEATEGIPTGRQRIVYNSKDLQDDDRLDDTSIFNIDPSNGVVIHLLPVRIRVRFEWIKPGVGNEFAMDRVILVEVDLEGPIRAIEQNDYIRHELKLHGGSLDSAKLYVLGSDRTQPAMDINQPFSSYGIHHNDVIDVVCEWKSVGVGMELSRTAVPISLPQTPGATQVEFVCVDDKEPEFSNSLDPEESGIVAIPASLPLPSAPERRLVRARYNWDGEMMHPAVKGLSLKFDALIELIEQYHSSQPGWLYGTPLDRSEREFFWQSKKEGYFPECLVSVVEEKATDQYSEVADLTEIPPLPPFRYPPAEGGTFHMPIADGGDSYIDLMVDYEHSTACPITAPTHVTVSLRCSAYNNRRISAVSVWLTIPHNTVTEVKIRENEAHRKEYRSEQEITESWSEEKQFKGFGVGVLGNTFDLKGKISKEHSFNNTEKGTKISRRKVDVNIFENKIHWNLKAPMTKLDEDGLNGNGEESITFVLKKKPIKFKYECRVTHERHGAEKTVKRISRDWGLAQLI